MGKNPKFAAMTVNNSDFSENPRHSSNSRRIVRVFFGRKLALFGFIIIMSLIFIAIFAPLLAPYDPDENDLDKRLQKPSQEHLLGTDSAGRDVLSRIIYGARTSMTIGLIAVGTSTVIGVLLGLIAAYFGGIIFNIIMRFVDAMMAIPPILLILIIASLLGGGIVNIIVALSIGQIAGKARMMCGMALTIKQNEYVTAARSIGASNLRTMLLHILPNAFPPIIVMVSMSFGGCIMAEAGLSFLGIGIAPPTAAWGSMVSEGQKFLLWNPILAVAPGLAIGLVVFGFNMLGDGLRDALDPRLKGTL